MHLHTNIAHLRKMHGFTQDIVAGALGIKRSSYSGYERGTAEPDAAALMRMGDYFRIPLDVLLRNDLTTIPTSRIEEMQRSYEGYRHSF